MEGRYKLIFNRRHIIALLRSFLSKTLYHICLQGVFSPDLDFYVELSSKYWLWMCRLLLNKVYSHSDQLTFLAWRKIYSFSPWNRLLIIFTEKYAPTVWVLINLWRHHSPFTIQIFSRSENILAKELSGNIAQSPWHVHIWDKKGQNETKPKAIETHLNCLSLQLIFPLDQYKIV